MESVTALPELNDWLGRETVIRSWLCPDNIASQRSMLNEMQSNICTMNSILACGTRGRREFWQRCKFEIVYALNWFMPKSSDSFAEKFLFRDIRIWSGDFWWTRSKTCQIAIRLSLIFIFRGQRATAFWRHLQESVRGFAVVFNVSLSIWHYCLFRSLDAIRRTSASSIALLSRMTTAGRLFQF
jgi:hypothetical protein